MNSALQAGGSCRREVRIGLGGTAACRELVEDCGAALHFLIWKLPYEAMSRLPDYVDRFGENGSSTRWRRSRPQLPTRGAIAKSN